jgi:hypothetical protein
MSILCDHAENLPIISQCRVLEKFGFPYFFVEFLAHSHGDHKSNSTSSERAEDDVQADEVPARSAKQ